MTGENLSGREGIKVTRNHEVQVDWTRLDYSEEYLNLSAENGLTRRQELDNLTTRLVRAGTEEGAQKVAHEEELSKNLLDSLVVAKVIREDIAKVEGHTTHQVFPPQAGGPPPRQDEEQEGMFHSPKLPHSPTLHSPTLPHPPKTPFG